MKEAIISVLGKDARVVRSKYGYTVKASNMKDMSDKITALRAAPEMKSYTVRAASTSWTNYDIDITF